MLNSFLSNSASVLKDDVESSRFLLLSACQQFYAACGALTPLLGVHHRPLCLGRYC